MSQTFKGILLAHEGLHVMRFLEHPYEEQSEEEYCEEERIAHEFQNRLMLALGGRAYENLLQAEANRLYADVKKSGRRVSEAFSEKGKYHAEMDAIFGPALSDYEREFRETGLWIHANFIVIDRYVKKDAEDAKSRFLLTIYQENGILAYR